MSSLKTLGDGVGDLDSSVGFAAQSNNAALCLIGNPDIRYIYPQRGSQGDLVVLLL